MLKKCANHIGNTYNSISFGVCVCCWLGAGVRGVIDVYFDYFTNTLNFSNSRIYLTNQQPTTKKLIKLNSQSGCF